LIRTTPVRLLSTGKCFGVQPLPRVVHPASLSRAFPRPPTWFRRARNGCTKSSTTGSRSSAVAMAIEFASSRAVATIGPGRVPRIAEALAKLRVQSVTLDGEGVVCREDDVSDFDKLRAAVGRLGSRDAFLYAFDLLEINGTDLRRDSWEVRRATLTSVLRRARDGIRLSEHLVTTDGNIVAKRRDRPYRSGRSPDWIKVKNPDAPAASRIW
jgi:ATP dependent DNA ligase domain